MADNELQHIGVRDFRNNIKNILDGTCFLNHRYIVLRHGIPMAQVTPPMPEADDSISVTQVRGQTKIILESVYYQGKTFSILRYGQPAATISPLEYVADDEYSEKETPLAAVSTGLPSAGQSEAWK